MEGIEPVVIGSAAVGSAVIGSAVGGLLGAATFFAVEGLMPRTATAERLDPAGWVMCHAPKNSVECSVNHQRNEALEQWLHQLPHELSPFSYLVLGHSPDLHHNFAGFTPKLCSGLHQKGCDLEGVEGQQPQIFTP